MLRQLTEDEAWIVSHNLELVGWYLKGRSYDDVTWDDLVAAGHLGLCYAIRRYDPERACWSTYAHYWIHRFIQIELQKRSLVHVPSYHRSARTHPKHVVSRAKNREATDRIDAARRVQWTDDEAVAALAVTPRHRPEDQMMARSIVLDGLKYLSDRERCIVERTWMRDESVKDVARDMGLSYSHLLVIRARAKQVLMRRLDETELRKVVTS